MTVEVTYIASGFAETVQNGGNPQQIEVTVAIQDLPPNSDVNIHQFFQQLPPNGRYALTGYLIPYNDSFTIEPAQQIRIGQSHEFIRVYHTDMRTYKQNGLPVYARRYLQPNQLPTPFEDAIIQPL